MQTNNREVTYARLQTILHVPGVGQVAETLTTSNAGAKKITQMRLADGLLFVTCQAVEFAVPLANITHLVFAPLKAATT